MAILLNLVKFVQGRSVFLDRWTRLFSVHRAARRWTISSWWIGFTSWGDHTTEAYSTCGRTRLLYSFSLMRGDRTLMFLLMNPSALLAREQV